MFHHIRTALLQTSVVPLAPAGPQPLIIQGTLLVSSEFFFCVVNPTGLTPKFSMLSNGAPGPTLQKALENSETTLWVAYQPSVPAGTYDLEFHLEDCAQCKLGALLAPTDGGFTQRVVQWGDGWDQLILCASACNDIPAQGPSSTKWVNLFTNWAALNNPKLKHYDTSHVENMSFTFSGCTSLDQDLSGWDVSNVTEHTDFDFNTPAWQPQHKPVFPT